MQNSYDFLQRTEIYQKLHATKLIKRSSAKRIAAKYMQNFKYFQQNSSLDQPLAFDCLLGNAILRLINNASWILVLYSNDHFSKIWKDMFKPFKRN